MQAILILAHRDTEQVLRLADKLRQSFEMYIHFDTKLKLSNQEKQKKDQHCAGKRNADATTEHPEIDVSGQTSESEPRKPGHAGHQDHDANQNN